MNFLYVFERFVRWTRRVSYVGRKKTKEGKKSKAKNSQSKLLLELVNFNQLYTEYTMVNIDDFFKLSKTASSVCILLCEI